MKDELCMRSEMLEKQYLINISMARKIPDYSSIRETFKEFATNKLRNGS
jgi:hypothetical protein